jgi:hypothetical protein
MVAPTFHAEMFSTSTEGFRQFQKVSKCQSVKVSATMAATMAATAGTLGHDHDFAAAKTSDGPAANPDEEEPYTPRTPTTATSSIGVHRGHGRGGGQV